VRFKVISIERSYMFNISRFCINTRPNFADVVRADVDWTDIYRTDIYWTDIYWTDIYWALPSKNMRESNFILIE
jgi:hypothetical protein